MDTARHIRALTGLDLFAGAEPGLVVLEAATVAVAVSRSRVPEREIFVDRCRREGVEVVVRPSGGGAVVLAPGVVVANLVVRQGPLTRSPEACFRRYCGLAVDALADGGIHGVEMRGVSDLCLGDRKIAGSSLRLWHGLVLFQFSLLVDPDLSLLARYLRMPSRAPEYRRGREHAAFVTSLRQDGYHTTREQAIALVRERLLAEVAAGQA